MVQQEKLLFWKEKRRAVADEPATIESPKNNMHDATLCLLIKPARNASPASNASPARNAVSAADWRSDAGWYSDAGGDNEILLAMKKRGFGMGKWNGVGGKPDLEKGDKTIIDTAIRETEEEIGVKPSNLKKVALLRFRFPYEENWNQDVYVFLTNNWEGELKESEEMLPKWFKTSEIPYQEMWDDDKFWLPHILAGKKLEADFIFKEGEKIDKHTINFVSEI